IALACNAFESSGQSAAIAAMMSRICSASGEKRGSARSSSWTRSGVVWVTSTYVTLSFVMTTDLGRPRDPRIDSAVLRSTVELLGETGYAELSVDAIARRAGTSKPAIYRRWLSKAHVLHEAVFPNDSGTDLPDPGLLEGDVREMVRRTVAVLTTPAARAALPGLVGEMAADLTLHAALLARFGDILSRGLSDRLSDAVGRGEVLPDITAAEVVEAVAGTTFLALLTRGAALDDAWIERTAAFITRGIST